MMRKSVEADGRGGLRELYVDRGPGRALVGHDRPMAPVVVSAEGLSNAAVAEGVRQVPLGRAA